MDEFISLESIVKMPLGSNFQNEVDQAIHEVRRSALVGTSPDLVLQTVFEALSIFVPFDRVGLATRDGGSLCSRWVKSRMPVIHLKVGYTAPIAGSSLDEIIASRCPRVISDLRDYLRLHPDSKSTELAIKDGIRSSLTFPLEMNDDVIGIVFFSSAATNVYTMEHLKLLEFVAQALAVVVDNATRIRRPKDETDKSLAFSKMVHDLRSPLAVISGFAEILADAEEFNHLSESSKNLLSVIRRNNQDLMAMVDDISELNSLKQNSTAIRPQLNPVTEFIATIESFLKPIADRRKISFVVIRDFDSGLTWRFDTLRIRQVLENLVSNAVKYSANGTLVQLTISQRGERLMFSVRDTGQGIPEDEVPKLFKVYSTTSVKPLGGEKSTGLGLAICKAIIVGHAGEISVKTRVGEGSTFEFWIPKWFEPEVTRNKFLDANQAH